MNQRPGMHPLCTVALGALLALGAAGSGGLGAQAVASSPVDDVDLLLAHGRFYPVSAPGAVEGSLAVRDGRIVALGPAEGAAELVGPETRVIQLDQRAVTPGWIDAHAHLAGLGAALSRVDLVGTGSYAEVVRTVQEAAAGLPPGAWVRGRGWDQNDWEVQEFPDRRELDAALPDRPVWLTRVDGHAALLNGRALELMGLDAGTVDPEGGRLLRDETGRLTGVLVDAAMELGADRLPQPGIEVVRDWIVRAGRHAVSLGLTTVTEMGIGEHELAAYGALRSRDALPIRVAAFLGDDPELLQEWFARGPRLDPEAWFTVRGVKLYADGALGSRGAALIEPYADDSGNLGLLTSSMEHLARVAGQALEAGYQVGIHAIGDRGNLVALDALERAFDGRPRPQSRSRIEHAQVLRLPDIARLAELGLIASVQPTHATSDMPWAPDRLGERRLAGAYAWRKMLAAGARLALGSDFPVESADPLLGFYAAVTRQDPEGQPPGGWLPEERLSRHEALRGFTLDAAYSLFLDDQVGSLDVGKRADLVVFESDPMRVPAAEIPDIEVDLVILDGKIVYQRRDRS